MQVQPGEALILTLTTKGCAPGNAIAIYCGNTIVTGRFDVVQNIPEENRYTVNGTPGTGSLCVKLNGVRALTFYRDYWFICRGRFHVADTAMLPLVARGEDWPQ